MKRRARRRFQQRRDAAERSTTDVEKVDRMCALPGGGDGALEPVVHARDRAEKRRQNRVEMSPELARMTVPTTPDEYSSFPFVPSERDACMADVEMETTTPQALFEEEFMLADGGNSIVVEAVAYDDEMWFLGCLFDGLDASKATRSSIASTTVEMGRLTASDGAVDLEWSLESRPGFLQTPRLHMTISK